MNLDDRLAQAWGEVTHDSIPLETLHARIKAQRRRRLLLRSMEAALTVAAMIILGAPLIRGGMTPVHWLLLPFYAVFLPIAWTLILRTPRHTPSDATENVRTFARLRMAQLRTSLRDIHVARRVAAALLVYAVLATGATWWLGSADWRLDAIWLLVVALLWAVGTQAVTGRVRRQRLREYRAMRRLLG